VFELHAAGKAKVTREIRSLDQVNESSADLQAGVSPPGSSSSRIAARRQTRCGS
jgi:hypothetical protein